MANSQIRFRPGLVPTLATLLLFPLLIWLGVWQLHRAQEKTQLQAELDARNRINPIVISATPQRALDLQYFRVTAQGYYDPRYQILLDNQTHDGYVGYDVITPLRIAGSDMRVLVNRGWVPLGVDRQHLPKIQTPEGVQRISGIATIPDPHYFTLARPGPVTGPWQTVWEDMDMHRYGKAAPFPLQPVVILLDPDSQAGGFLRKWRRPDTGIAMHQSYAFQWFALATALVIIYIWVNLQRVGEDTGESGKEKK